MIVSDVLIICALSIGVAVFGYGLVNKLRKFFLLRGQNKRRSHIVQEILHQALAQRSLLRMEVMQGDFQGFSAEGSCNTITKSHIVLQVTDAFGTHQWVDVPLQVFFSIQQNGKASFYHFVGRTLKSTRRDSFTELHVALPKSISPGQKRAFLRYTPPKPSILALGMWILADTSPLPQTRSSLAKPHLLFRPTTQNDMVLDNISAGGLRVCLHERAMERYKSRIKCGSRLLFLLVLANKKNADEHEAFTLDSQQEQSEDGSHVAVEKTTLNFWLSCEVMSLLQEEKNNLWKVAMRFEKWAYLDEGYKKIEWFPTDSNRSIPALSTWIMRAHMEQTRKI